MGDFVWGYDVSPADGRFLMIRQVEADQPLEANITVTINWHEELAQIAGTQ